MPSNIRLELPGAIDPHLNWKTRAKHRQWAVRRARTSFDRGIKNSMTKCSKGSEDAMDKGPKRADSQKIGVSASGRRIGDNLKIVPIKKRNFLLVSSPLSPHQETAAYDRHHIKGIVTDEITSLNYINEEASDAVVFSEISILAAADACYNETVSDAINAGGLVLQGHSCKEVLLEDAEGVESHSLYEDIEQQSQSI